MTDSLDLKNKKIVAILGPTGSGKSALALELARKYKGEIVSCDSVQVYKHFDIGSAKPTKEEQTEIIHHMIDIKEIGEDYDAAQFAVEARKKIEDIQKRGNLPIVCGGTGFYFRALSGMNFHDFPQDPILREKLKQQESDELYAQLLEKDPVRAKELHPNDKFRVARALEIILLTGKPFSEQIVEKPEHNLDEFHKIVLTPDKIELEKRIVKRTEQMLKTGLIEETENILAMGCPREFRPLSSIGYLQVMDYLDGKLKKEELQEKIVIATRQYARKQMMFFSRI